jgi:hypothetical protein
LVSKLQWGKRQGISPGEAVKREHEKPLTAKFAKIAQRSQRDAYGTWNVPILTGFRDEFPKYTV